VKKLLIISGPTATGKTDIAIKLAKEFNGELINADSRQLYIGMDIGTGKDHPVGVKLNLIDLIKPSESFSVAQYRQLALKEIARIQSENKLPILVGGSGMYIDSVVNPQPTYSIKPNIFLRFLFNKLSVKYLQKIYLFLDKKNYLLLNNSDKNNPHRLIRKIEIKLSNFFHPALLREGLGEGFDVFHISLTAPNKYLFKKIDQRIQKRLDLGLLTEISNLLQYYSWDSPGLKTIAYKEFKNINPIPLWTTDEHNLVRRQKTWFKKQPNIIFFDISKPGIYPPISHQVKKWYNNL
jgi:tRNA dimethylallyltransferase